MFGFAQLVCVRAAIIRTYLIIDANMKVASSGDDGLVLILDGVGRDQGSIVFSLF